MKKNFSTALLFVATLVVAKWRGVFPVPVFGAVFSYSFPRPLGVRR